MGNFKLYRSLNTGGYTLVETLVASFLILMIVGAAWFGLRLMQNSNLESEALVGESSISVMGSDFVKIAEGADMSMMFTHLPVPTSGCSDHLPCIRKLNSEAGRFEAAGTLPAELSGKSIEFFRDHFSNIEGNLKLQLGHPSNARIYYTKSFQSALVDKDDNIYATWPLSSPSSNPFPIVTRKNSLFSFVFEDITGTSSPNGDESLFSIIGSVPPQSELNELTNSLVIFYNSYDPKQFVTSRISKVTSCKYSMGSCDQWKTNQGLTTLTLGQQHIILELKSIDTAAISDFLPKDSSGGFPGSTSLTFLSTRVNILEAGNVDLDASEPFHIRKWSHFGHTISAPQKIIGTPVSIFKYEIKINSGKKNLVRSEIDGAGTIRSLVEIDDLAESVIFARQLGSNTINIFVF